MYKKETINPFNRTLDDCTYEVRISPHTCVPFINIHYTVTINKQDRFTGCFIRTVAMYANSADVSFRMFFPGKCTATARHSPFR
jgi:hypothetical protein